jgi:hypothetical protein
MIDTLPDEILAIPKGVRRGIVVRHRSMAVGAQAVGEEAPLPEIAVEIITRRMWKNRDAASTPKNQDHQRTFAEPGAVWHKQQHEESHAPGCSKEEYEGAPRQAAATIEAESKPR